MPTLTWISGLLGWARVGERQHAATSAGGVALLAVVALTAWGA